MTRQAQYCNAQSFELSVKTSPIKCREISTIKTIFDFAQVRLHRTIPMRFRPILVASVRQVGTPTAVDADGCAAYLDPRALLPVAGRW